jgi:maltooligosyltrehalose synthase
VELSEQAPNINDLVTVLDFPEMEVWNDFLQQCDIQMVRELPVDIATELNDAYAISGSLQRLLELFRTQSLAKAPLHERIETLRKLAVEDQANTQWSVDLKTFETHCIGLLKNELQKAIKDQDLNHVASLDQELSAGRWAVKVPAKILDTAREGHQQLRQVSARQELETLCPQLSDAYSAFDRPNAITLQNRFFALAEILDLQESDPFYELPVGDP